MVTVLSGLFVLLASAGVAAAQEAPAPGPPAAPTDIPSAEPTVEDLYRTILPRPIGDPAAEAGDAASTSAATGGTSDEGGLHLGRTRLNPAFHLSYVRATGAFLDTADPVKDSYLELRPGIGAEAPLGSGFLRGSYLATIRRGSSFERVDSAVTHVVDLAVDLPIGGIGELTAAEHYARGLLETTEVDPGREYFFGLGRFTHRRHSVGLQLLPEGRTNVALAGSLDTARVDDEAAFFDHETQAASARVGYELRPGMRAAAGYGYERVPFTSERPQAESSAHSVFGELRGEVLPLTTGHVSVGYSRLTSPRAGAEGRNFSGTIASVSLEKSFTRASRLILTGGRGTHASAFEENGFFVSTTAAMTLRMGLPASVALDVGAGYHRNSYRLPASSIGVPRQDVIRGFTIGVGRSITRHALIRADYRRERRVSNIDAFDSRSNALSVQLGIRPFAAAPE